MKTADELVRREPPRHSWGALIGGLIALGLTVLVIRELPAIRRELNIMRM